LKIFGCAILRILPANAASKTHTAALGRWTTILWRGQASASKPRDLKIRPLFVDGRNKEFTVGVIQDATERTFVTQRIYRINDSLPPENGPARGRWQLGGWLLVDRVSGKIQAITLPDFDPDSSALIWFRDYAAYYGTSDDGQKISAVIFQLGRRKPLLKKTIGQLRDSPQTCLSTTRAAQIAGP
jgi:hypothetical protein